MATRSLNVQITGDAKNLNRVLADTEHRTKRSMGAIGKGFAVAGAAAAGGLAVGLKKSAEAAIEAEKSQAKMVTQLRAAGVSYKDHAKQIDEVIQKTSQLSGLDDEDLQDSFTNIVRVTGDVNKSLKLTGLAADFARAKHMDVAKAGELVGKVAGGNTGILSRYGITLDKGATSTEALGVLQQKFAGQADAYGKTTAGAMDRASVASENLGEIVGTKLTPWLAKGATALVNLVDKAGQLGGPIRKASGAVADAYNAMIAVVRRFVNRNRSDIDSVIGAVRNLGKAMRFVFEEIIVPVVRVAIRAVGRILENVVQVLRGVIRVVSGVLTGNWRKAWDGIKDIVTGAMKLIGNTLRGAVEIMGTLAVRIGKQIVRGIIKGTAGLSGALRTALVRGIREATSDISVSDLILKGPLLNLGKKIVDGVGDGVGKGIGLGYMGSTGGPGSLMGADRDLMPFASIAGRMGLQTTSGLRPGSVTSSGNPSYHASGDAIDESGPPGAMLRYFKVLRATFGSRLRELIYTPGGVGIKDGRPYRYSGQVAADHYDHVHVAYSGPFGDGVGRASKKPPPIGEKTMKWMQGIWGRIAPMLGQDPGTNVRDLFKYTEGKGLFVGVDGINPKKGEFGLMWPKWLGKPDKGLTQLFIHEMAHRFQKTGATGSYRLAEGGAEAFARRVMAAQFGGPVSSSTYAGLADWVTKNKGENWINYGQFGRKPGTGDGIGDIRNLWTRAGGSAGKANLAAAVAMAESSGDPKAFNRNSDGSVDRGLWQINSVHGALSTFDRLRNAKAAVRISGNGSNWNPWVTFKSGAFRRFLADDAPSEGGSRSGAGAGARSRFAASRRRTTQRQRAATQRAQGNRPGTPTGPPNSFGFGGSPTWPHEEPVPWWEKELPEAGSGEDPNRALIESNEALKAATDAHTAALTEVGAQMKRQTDFATSAMATDKFQALKMATDLISGHFGRSLVGRSFTPGTGTEVAF